MLAEEANTPLCVGLSSVKNKQEAGKMQKLLLFSWSILTSRMMQILAGFRTFSE